MPGQWSATSGNTTTDGTEQTLFDSIAGADSPVNATFAFYIAGTNMAAADGMTIRIYKKVVGDSTSRVLYKQSFSGAQPTDDMVKVGPSIGTTNGIKVTITRDTGTDRAYRWETTSA